MAGNDGQLLPDLEPAAAAAAVVAYCPFSLCIGLGLVMALLRTVSTAMPRARVTSPLVHTNLSTTASSSLRAKKADAEGNLGPDSIENCWLEFWLEKPREFLLDIHYTKKGSFDLSQNQNGISSGFSNQNSSRFFFSIELPPWPPACGIRGPATPWTPRTWRRRRARARSA